MDQDTAIKVQKVTKSFKIPLDPSSGMKQSLINFRKRRKGFREFTPLKDISFEIKKGDFFGIVGRNGSGKSTLLKTIAGIYSPNGGSVTVSGTLIPFIELGVGFNPELTGRENVFLNGALLGFSRTEMEKMYDDIVEFAELDDFMDERLKNYSSGMQVRLAFSIAIRAEGDILLLDEVLAVGDEAFQKKCFDYFEQLRKDNRTVILVSHDMGSVKRFCTKAILIENGKIKASGTPDDIANQYTLDNLSVHDGDKEQGSKGMVVSGNIKSLRIVPKSSHVVSREDTLEFDVEYEYKGNVNGLFLGISLLRQTVPVIERNTIGLKPMKDDGKKITYSYRLPLGRFTEGSFAVSAAVLGIKDKNLVAFTTDEGNFSFTIINDGENVGGLLMDRGEWK